MMGPEMSVTDSARTQFISSVSASSSWFVVDVGTRALDGGGPSPSSCVVSATRFRFLGFSPLNESGFTILRAAESVFWLREMERGKSCGVNQIRL